MLTKRLNVCQKIAKCQFLSICSTSTASIQEHKEDDGYKEFRKSAVTAVNAITTSRSIVKVEPKQYPLRKFRREFNLPQSAIDGVRNALVTCERPAKQLQNEADQLANKLEQRRFPESPEKLKMVRDEIKKKLKLGKKDSSESLDNDDEAFGGKIKEAQEYQIRNEVDKLLKKSSFNWRPLEITTKEAAAAYSLARLAPNYSEISRCLEEFAAVPDFVPQTVLDYGSGSGAGFWAATSRWPDAQIGEITLIDPSDAMIRFAMDSIRKEVTTPGVIADDAGKPFLHNNVSFRRHLIPSLNTTYDLVIAHRVLCEIGSSETRLQLIESLWRRTNRFLVLVESSQSGAFGGILEARDFLLTAGITIDYERLIEIIQKHDCLTREILDTIESTRLSDYEKFEILRTLIPAGIELPTQLPTATVLAPCPHDLGCPLGVKDACTFSTRFRPIRADGKRSEKEKDGTETSKFTFVILEKGNRKVDSHTDRILKNRKLGKHVTCDVCTAFRGIQRITLSKKKHGNMYTDVRVRRDGDILPIKLKTVSATGMFDLPLED